MSAATINTPTMTASKLPSSSGATASMHETLTRLSSKPGVKASMVIDRSSGAVLSMSGSFLSVNASDAVRSSSSTSATAASSASIASAPSDAPTGQDDKSSSPFEDGVAALATKIASYVESTASLVQGMDGEVSISRGSTHGVKLTGYLYRTI